MKRFRLSPQAAEDIGQIWAYVAADNIRSARQIRLNLLDACRTVARNPRIGHPRQDLTDKPVLFWPSGSYLIVYNPAARPVEIVRILHGARDVPRLL